MHPPTHPLARLALWPLSIPYGQAARLRAEAYRRGWLTTERLPVPVVSVGNLTVGGTGKTPIVAAIASLLQDRGLRVGIVSRGYGRRHRGVQVVSRGDGEAVRADAREVGDEPLVLAASLPRCAVVVGADRVAAARAAVAQAGAQVIVADDAFQHLRLGRTIDLLAVDATNPSAAGWLLPAGALREPVAAAGRADAFIVTRCDRIGETIQLETLFRRQNARAPFFHAIARPVGIVGPEGAAEELEALAGETVVAFCGIARPRFFRQDLERAGASIAAFVEFPDHHWYADTEIQDVAARARASGATRVITTHKDRVRLTPRQRSLLPLSHLEIEVEFWDHRPFRRFLFERVGSEASA